MTITLELPPEVEAQFLAEAREQGVSLSEIVQAHLIRSHSLAEGVPSRLGIEEKERLLDELFDDIDAPSGVQEGAFHRESWYR